MWFFSTIISFVLVFLGIQEDPNSFESKFTYPCAVNNCQQCSFTNFCGKCQPGYLLNLNPITSEPFCKYIPCLISNCQQCYLDNMCEKCSDGYYTTQSGYCSKIQPTCSINNCLYCTNQLCKKCSYGYYLSQSDNQCYPIAGNQIDNCLVAFNQSSYMCQICQNNYIVNPAYQCYSYPTFSCDVDYCQFCSSNNYCAQCMSGFIMSDQGICSKLACDIRDCQICQNINTCLQCSKNYQLQNNQCVLKSYGCNVKNCIVCGQIPQVCSVCQTGYRAVYQYASGTQDSIKKKINSTCQLITQSYGGLAPVNNCLKFGILLPGTSDLSIGCVECEPNYYNVGGYCMANLQISSYQCDIVNCVYCIQNNVCGRCQEGYMIQLGSFSKCLKSYSPFPNCQQTAIFQAVCAACKPNYILSTNLNCIKADLNVSCQITGCQFCLQDNLCNQCREGYIFQSDSDECVPKCSIDNCFECQSESTCSICDAGYQLNSQKQQCITSIQTQCEVDQYGQGCLQCLNKACLKCEQPYTLNVHTNLCCLRAQHNAVGCLQYESVCSNECLVCRQGYTQISTYYYQKSLVQCVLIPCILDNCLFCPQGNICYVCAEGYQLNNKSLCIEAGVNQCSQMTQFCSSCYSSGQCAQCFEGYILYHGKCVCSMQNCLKCQGKAQCSICAFPTFASQNYNAPGCMLPYVPQIQCEVAACQQCIKPNLCSICADGYSLSSSNTCQLNNCKNIMNCLLCSSNQLTCYKCQDGYLQDSPLFGKCKNVGTNKQCFVPITNCAYCTNNSQDQSTCEQCVPGYSLDEQNNCIQNTCTDNCMICLEQFQQNPKCFICNQNYYLSQDYLCVPISSSTTNQCLNIQGCVQCQSDSKCSECSLGLIVVNGGDNCYPQQCTVENCQFCSNDQNVNDLQTCQVCQIGYTLTNIGYCLKNSLSILCDISNCLQCYTTNQCGQCAPTFVQYGGQCLTSLNCPANCEYCKDSLTCQVCDEGYRVNQYLQISNSVCIIDCLIPECLLCASDQQCQVCSQSYAPSQNGNQCLCAQNYVFQEDKCVCPQGYQIYNGQCYECPGEKCICYQNNVCSSCQDSYQVIQGQCTCPEGFTIDSSGQCTCPESGFNQEENQCYICSGQNCNQCSSDNYCAQCSNGYDNNDGQCQCNQPKVILQNICTCQQGYKQYNDQCIQCQIQYCEYCEEQNVCTQCQQIFVYENQQCVCPSQYSLYKQDAQNSFCMLCQSEYVNQCLQCSQQNFCQKCYDSFVAVNGICYCPQNTTYSQTLNSCISCNIQNCLLCNSESSQICQKCTPNTFLAGGRCIMCDIDNCLACTSNDFCVQCSGQSLVPSSNGNLCIECQIPNCAFCSSQNVCQQCELSYTLIQQRQVCVQCLIQGCQVCQTTNYCSKCAQSYQLQPSGVCTACPYPCLTCNTLNTQICLSCNYPFALKPNSNGSCYLCKIRKCQTCQNSQTCTQCFPGYHIQNNQCIELQVYNSNCQIYEKNQCVKCYSGYVLIENDCQLCGSKNCLECYTDNINLCSNCKTGFFNKGGICQECPFSNCQTCNSSMCFTYKQQVGQMNVIVNSTIAPAICDPGCLKCSEIQPTFCIRCDIGYTLVQQNQHSYCIPCNYPCILCSPNNPSLCYKCAYNYQTQISQDGNSVTCKQCSSELNCQTCGGQNNKYCTTCPQKYLLNQTCETKCNSDINAELCLSCLSIDKCLICIEGYSPGPQGSCLPCSSGCSKCASQQMNICLQCKIGFYFDEIYNCILCPQGCQSCLSSNTCTSCIDGYKLSNKQCLVQCPVSCASCIDSSTCTSCIAGYFLDRSSIGLATCISQIVNTTQLSQFCPYSYYISNGVCNKCEQSVSGCLRCSPSDNSRCITCSPGNYLSLPNYTCSSCQRGCQRCVNSDICLLCSQGYTSLQLSIETPLKQCVQCQHPCITCFSTPSSCLSCANGYNLFGFQCISKSYFQFNVQLQTSIPSFYNNYKDFLNTISSSLQYKNYLNITIRSVLSGSVNVIGGIQAQKQTILSLEDQQNNLYGIFLEGDKIAGMQILSSSLVYSQGQINSTMNDWIVIGIVAGIVLLLIIIITACLIYKKKKENKKPLQISPQISRKITDMTINTNIYQQKNKMIRQSLKNDGNQQIEMKDIERQSYW